MPVARVQMPDGRIGRFEVPDGTTPEQVESFVFNQTQPQEQPKSTARKALEVVAAPAETALALGSGAIGQILGRGAAVGKALLGGKVGTQEGAREAVETGESIANALTYRPRGEPAQSALHTIGSLLDRSKLAGLGPPEAMAMGALPVAQATTQAVAPLRTAGGRIANLVQPSEPAMAGVGAAETAAETMRRTRAESLPVPVKLSRGEASRNFEQQRFERETAKEGSEAGRLLRGHAAEESENIIKNMEWMMDETGAVAPSARVTGSTVDNALRARRDLGKAKYQDAYRRAEKAGEMADPIDPTPLLQFVAKNASSAELAPVLSAIEKEVVRLGGGARASNAPNAVVAQPMALNDVENLRKMVVRLGKVDETNGHYAKLANEVIDQMTEGKGGKLYAEARQLFKDHAAEFKNQGPIKKLLGTKPGTSDRAVAFEDVFDHSILRGSMDDTAAIFRSLEQAGPQGKQAVAELKGATMKYLQDQASKNAARDINGNPVLSYSKLNNAVRELEIIFGKKGAQQIRDITETIADLNVAPPGAMNTSTTSIVLMEALGAALSGRLPTATAKTFAGIKQAAGDYTKLRKTREALAGPEETIVQRPRGTVH